MDPAGWPNQQGPPSTLSCAAGARESGQLEPLSLEAVTVHTQVKGLSFWDTLVTAVFCPCQHMGPLGEGGLEWGRCVDRNASRGRPQGEGYSPWVAA